MRVPLRPAVWVFVFALSGSLFAQEADHAAAIDALRAKGGGLYSGDRTIFYTVRDVALLPDRAPVRLFGQILANITDDKYLFGEFDRTVQTQGGVERVAGERIVVEIDDDKWQGQVVTPSGSVEIVGEVDREGDAVTVKVKGITVRTIALIDAARQENPPPVEWLEERRNRLEKQIEARRKQVEAERQQDGQSERRRGERTKSTSDDDDREVARIFVREVLETPLIQYRINTGNYPTTEQGLTALLKAPLGNATNWRGPYIKQLPKDPWGNPYQYRFPGTRNLGKYDLWSYGPDGVESADDINNWSTLKAD